MPDVMLSPGNAAPAAAKSPAKATANGAKPASITEQNNVSDQPFSGVLAHQLQDQERPSEGHGAALGGDDREPGSGSEPATTPVLEAADGKPLPETGNSLQALFAALETHSGTAAVAMPATLGLELNPNQVQENGFGLMRQADKGGKDWLLAQLAPALRVASSEAMPESAKASLAEAVQAVLDTNTSDQDLLEAIRGATELRGLNTNLMQRGVGLESTTERVVQPGSGANQPLTPSVGAALPLTEAASRLPASNTSIEVPFRQPGWDQALSERVLWLVNQKFQGAEIKLNPPQLGPIEVRIHMHQDQAQIQFSAQHAAVRDALEAALPRLREMFAANGLGLGDVNVGQHAFAEQQRQMSDSRDGKFRAGSGQGEFDEAAVTKEQDVTSWVGTVRSGIDLFA